MSVQPGPPSFMELDIALAGFIVGTLVGLTGIGGGSLLTPALIVIFNVTPLTAVGTDLVFNAVTKLFGSAQHARQGTINYRLVLFLAIGSIPGALGGIGLISLLERVYDVDAGAVVIGVLSVILIFAGAIMVLRPLLDRRELPPTDVRIFVPFEVRRRITIALGLVTGFLVGITSIGSGALILPVLTLFYPLKMNRIVGTDIFHAMVLASVAAAAHWGAGNVDWGLAGNLLVGSIPGVLIGSRLLLVAPDRLMRPALAGLVIYSGVRLL